VSRLDSSSASLTRCASPPDSVVAALPERDVARPTSSSVCSLRAMVGTALKNVVRGFHRQVQDLRDVLALVEHFQRLAVVALAVADVAGHVHVGQKVHLDLDHAVALAGLAAAAGRR